MATLDQRQQGEQQVDSPPPPPSLSLSLSSSLSLSLSLPSSLLPSSLPLHNVLNLHSHIHTQIAQLKHTISQKEDLLKLYVRDATERDAEAAAAAEGSEANNPAGWVHALAEECRELRESNDQLQEEASHLRKETADIEQKERELVQQCLTQFGELDNDYRHGVTRE